MATPRERKRDEHQDDFDVDLRKGRPGGDRNAGEDKPGVFKRPRSAPPTTGGGGEEKGPPAITPSPGHGSRGE